MSKPLTSRSCMERAIVLRDRRARSGVLWPDAPKAYYSLEPMSRCYAPSLAPCSRSRVKKKRISMKDGS
jgi:hypothetical protein